MSRALDKSAVDVLDTEDPTTAYQTISKALIGHEGQNQKRLEIEILGKSHQLVPGTVLLQDGKAIAVSKIGLIQAFVVARKMLRYDLEAATVLAPEDLLAVTNVLLLMDPEHLTAANARKRLAVSAGNKSRELLLKIIKKDGCFIDSLLTSRLHRHTKSPTLWSHRRWLVDTAARHGVTQSIVDSIKDVVMVAGERHPRNYYAWSHARWLVNTLANEEILRTATEPLTATVKDWCYRNHTDTSGWSFLCFWITQVDKNTSSRVFEEAIGLAASLQWTNESTWVFLRMTAASGIVGVREVALFHDAVETLVKRTEDEEGMRVLKRARLWVETYYY